MSTLVAIQLNNQAGEEIKTIYPSGNSKGIAEWSNIDAPRAQRFVLTASTRSTGQNRKYTLKLRVPKVSTQVENGVELPVTAWNSHVNIEFTLPNYATEADIVTVVDSVESLFADGSAMREAISQANGFY